MKVWRRIAWGLVWIAGVVSVASVAALGAGEIADAAFDQSTVTIECQETEDVVVVVSIDPEAELEPSTFRITFDTTYLEVTGVQTLVSGDTGAPAYNNTTGVITHSQTWGGAGPTGGDIDVLRITLKGKAVTPGSPPDLAFIGGSGNTVIYVDGADATGALTDSPVVVEDTTPPVITLIGADTITLECCVDSYTELGATRTDACCVSDAVDIGGDTVDECVVGMYEVTYNVSDCAGNPADEVVRTVVVEDTVDPTFTYCPGNLVLACDHETNEEDIDDWLDSPTATDTCGEVTISDNFTGLSGGCSPSTGTALVTWTADDGSGNTDTCQASLTVLSDTRDPWFDELPEDLLVLESELWSVDIASLTASDECDADPQVRYVREIGNRRGTSYLLKREYEARDACGNSVTHTQHIGVVVILADLVLAPGDPIDPDHTGAIETLREQPFETIVEYHDDVYPGCPERIQRTWVVYDRRNPELSVEAVQWLTVQDVMPPAVEATFSGIPGALDVLLATSEPTGDVPSVLLEGSPVAPVASLGEDRSTYTFGFPVDEESGALLEVSLADACGNAYGYRAWISPGIVDLAGQLVVRDKNLALSVASLPARADERYTAVFRPMHEPGDEVSLALDLIGPPIPADASVTVSVKVRRSLVELLLPLPPSPTFSLLLTVPGWPQRVVLELVFDTGSDSYVVEQEVWGAQ